MSRAPALVSMLDDIQPPPDLPDHPDILANSCCGTLIEALCFFCGGTCAIIPESQAAVQLFCGKYTGTISDPGCYYRNSCCVELRRVSTAINAYDLPNVKVADARGNTLVVSAIVTWQIIEPRRAALDVADTASFVAAQAPAVLKAVVAQYPYESPDQPSLRTEPVSVADALRRGLQVKVLPAGVKIHAFTLNELSYAPEIAATMLKRQQAEALIDARRKMAQGAVAVATDAAQQLGTSMTEQDRSRMLANLVVVLMAEKDVVPTVPLS